MTDTTDDTIAGYRILRRVFADPRGEIAIATPEQAPRFADKVVLRISPFATLGSEVSVRDYMRRAALYATLSHSSIIQAYELSTANSAVVLVLEYCEGVALDDFRATLDAIGVEVPDDVVFYIGLRTLGALTAAHAARDPGDGSHTPVVHGNVRPECILIPWDGYVRLAEFEVARISAVWRGVEAASRPTPSRYMAPEQVNSGLASVKTDVYSVALVMWELLTKMVAVPQSLSGSSLARAMAKPKFAPLGRVRPDLPTKLLSIMDRALAPAAQRTVTAPEMLAVLRELTATDQAEAKLLTLLERVRSGPAVGARRRSQPSLPSVKEALDRTNRQEQEATQVGELDLLEETTLEAEGIRPATTPPPLPAMRPSVAKLAAAPPRPKLTTSSGMPALPRPAAASQAHLQAIPGTAPPGPLTEPAPPPGLMTERPAATFAAELAPLLEQMPQSERIPRVRESSGRIGLLEWSATPSSEILGAPGLLEANPLVQAASPARHGQLGGHTLPLLAPMDPFAPAATPAVVETADAPKDAAAALFGGTPAPPRLPPVSPAGTPPSGSGFPAAAHAVGSGYPPASRPSQLSIETFGTFPSKAVAAAPPSRGASRLGYALLLLVGAGFGVGLYFMANDKLNAKPAPRPPASAVVARSAAASSAPVVTASPTPSAMPVHSAPSAPSFAEKPVADKPVADKPVADKPVADKPVAAKPAEPSARSDRHGALDTSGVPGDRRIWVDDKLLGQTGGTLTAPCGLHSVKIGSGGTPHDVMIPCGGSVTVR